MTFNTNRDIFNYMNNKKINLVPRMVYAEPELWRLLRRLSIHYGCFHKESGSSSEVMRRGVKTWLLKKEPQLKNIKDINWDELYI